MKKRLQIAVEKGLAKEIRAAARQRRMSISAWLVDAAKAKLRSEALREVLDEWERENGPITEDELERAQAELGLRPAEPSESTS